MSSYALEILAGCHSRGEFVSGLESVDRYLRETARSHLEKGVSVTRVLVAAEATPPKTVLVFFTLSNIAVEARECSHIAHTKPGLIRAFWRVLAHKWISSVRLDSSHKPLISSDLSR